MKLSKQKLKQIIKEELLSEDGNENKQISLLGQILGAIESVDMSLDYIAAAITGDDPVSIAARQSSIGRYARPPVQAPHPAVREELEKIIKEELTHYLANIYKWCPSGTKCTNEKQKTTWWKE